MRIGRQAIGLCGWHGFLRCMRTRGGGGHMFINLMSADDWFFEQSIANGTNVGSMSQGEEEG